MTPPGWRTPGARDPRVRAYEAVRASTAAASSEPVPLPCPRLAALGPGLWPGLHLVVGPHGAGSTQLGVQTAVEAALRRRRAQLCLPATAPREAALRVAAVLSGTPWGDLAAAAPEVAERELERLEGSPLALGPLGAGDGEAALDGCELRVLDPAPSGAGLAELRVAALRAEAAVLAVAPSVAPSDPEAPDRLRLPEEDVALADQVLLLAPEPGPRAAGAPHPTRVGVAKSRRGVPGWARLVFDGARFSDEPDELDLGVT